MSLTLKFKLSLAPMTGINKLSVQFTAGLKLN